MHFHPTILPLLLATSITTTVAATSLSSSPAFTSATDGKCTTGNISCCNPSNSVQTDGVLNNLLSWGLISSLVDDEGSACASASVIDELGLLSLVKDTDQGPVCENIIACCPGEGATCVAIGGTDGSDYGQSQ